MSLEERVDALERKLSGIIFLDGCSTPIDVTTKRLQLDWADTTDGKIKTLIERSKDIEKELSTVLDVTPTEEVTKEFVFGCILHVLTSICYGRPTHIFTGSSVEQLSQLRQLEELLIVENRLITDLKPLRYCTSLRELGIFSCISCVNFSVLSVCKSLETIVIAGSNISNASFAQELPNLRLLQFIHCPNMVDFELPGVEVSVNR